MTGPKGPKKSTSIKDSVAEVLKHNEIKEGLKKLDENIEVSDTELKKTIDHVKSLVKEIDKNGEGFTAVKNELTDAIKTNLGGNPENKKLQWVVKFLGLEGIVDIPASEESLPVAVVAATETLATTTTTQVVPPVTPSTESYDDVMRRIRKQSKDLPTILDRIKIGPVQTTQEAIAKIMERVKRDLEGIKADQEAARKSAKEGGFSFNVMKINALKKLKQPTVPSYLSILGITEMNLGSFKNIEALKTEAEKKLKEMMKEVTDQDIQRISRPEENVEKVYELSKTIPEWAKEDQLARDYDEWVTKKGGRKSFDYWLNNAREIPADEKGVWGMFNRPWFKKVLHQLSKFFSQLTGIWNKLTTGKDKENEKPKESEMEERMRKKVEGLEAEKKREDRIKKLQATPKSWKTVRIAGLSTEAERKSKLKGLPDDELEFLEKIIVKKKASPLIKELTITTRKKALKLPSLMKIDDLADQDPPAVTYDADTKKIKFASKDPQDIATLTDRQIEAAYVTQNEEKPEEKAETIPEKWSDFLEGDILSEEQLKNPNVKKGFTELFRFLNEKKETILVPKDFKLNTEDVEAFIKGVGEGTFGIEEDDFHEEESWLKEEGPVYYEDGKTKLDDTPDKFLQVDETDDAEDSNSDANFVNIKAFFSWLKKGQKTKK